MHGELLRVEGLATTDQKPSLPGPEWLLYERRTLAEHR